MKFSDITDWFEDYSALDDLEDQVLNRIGAYLDNAESTVPNDDLRQSLFANMLYKDPTAYKLFAKNNPDAMKNIQVLVYGKPFNWEPDQIAQLMGVKNPKDLFVKDELGIPHWKKLAGADETPEQMSKNLDEFYGFEDTSEKSKGRLYKWLEAAQKQYDNSEKYTGGAANATRGTFAPRVQESLQRYGDYDWKDVLGDLGENIAQLMPWSRGAADLGKIALGTKALGRYTLPTVRTAEMLASNAAAPLWGEAYDAAAYNDLENPNRSRFNIGDVIGGTATNMSTAPIVGGLASTASRTAGIDGINRKTVRDFLSTDPYTTSLHRMEELSSKAPFETKYSPAQLDLEGEVYGKVFGYPIRKVKKAGKAQRKSYEENLGLDKIQTGDLKTDVDLIKKQVMPYLVKQGKIDEAKTVEGILEIMETMLQEGEKRGQMSYEGFLRNREHMTPTAILEAQGLGGKYGELDNKIADVGTIASNPSIEHGLMAMVKPNRSASKLRKDAMGSKSVDKTYPVVETPFDKTVMNLENNPDVVNYASKGKAFKPVLTGFVTNKLGKKEYGSKLTGEDLNATEIDDDVANILNDNAIIRMWDSGFEPKGNPNEPTMKAYEIYKTNKNKGTKHKFGKNAGL